MTDLVREEALSRNHSSSWKFVVGESVHVYVPSLSRPVQVFPVRPPHIGEIYRRQKQRSFHGTTLSNGGIGGQSVNGANTYMTSAKFDSPFRLFTPPSRLRTSFMRFAPRCGPGAEAERRPGVDGGQAAESARAAGAEAELIHRVQKFKHGTRSAVALPTGKIWGLGFGRHLETSNHISDCLKS